MNSISEAFTNEAFITILSTIIVFPTYLLISFLEKKISFKHLKSNKSKYYTILSRVTGMFILGIIPGILIISLTSKDFSDYGVSSLNFQYSLYYFLLLFIIIIPLSYINSKKDDNLKLYPQIRNKNWAKNTLFLSAISWIIYLCGYEFLLRGLLLFSCLREFGIYPAIAINIVIYSIMHIHKGKKETIGAIPLGLVFCILTINTETIWAALFVHIIIALSNEWFSLYHHPDMKILKRKLKS